jgi:hypothetical protein
LSPIDRVSLCLRTPATTPIRLIKPTTKPATIINILRHVKFEVLTVSSMKKTASCDVTACSLADIYQYDGGTFCSLSSRLDARGSVVVKALWYKPEGRGFHSR